MTEINEALVDVLTAYDAWKNRTAAPDYSPQAFTDWFHTEEVLRVTQEIWGDNGQSMYDSSELKAMLSASAQDWLNHKHAEQKAEIE